MREPADLHDAALRDRAVRAARGREPFDVLLTSGAVIDMATGEIRPADVGLVGPLIASVHPSGQLADARNVIDIKGGLIAPGLIDMHMHVESSMITPRRYAETVIPQGTTTIVWDPHEVGNVLGLEGVRWAIDASRNLPLRVLPLAPSCVPSAPGLERAGAEINGPEMREMLSWPEIAGVAEVMDMRGVIERSAHMSSIVDEGLKSGKLVCGHARGLKGADLQGFAAAGIESDHEISDGEDLLAKLRAGFTIELRGSHDYVLPGAVEALNSLPRIPQTLTICTDDIFPDDLVAVGGIIDVVRRLVRYDLPAIEALRAATLNAAMRLGRRDLGLVAPGKRADLIVLDDLAELRVRHVFASGVHVAAEDRLLVDARPDPYAAPTSTMKLDPLSPDDFLIKTGSVTTGDVRLRTIFRPRFTEWREAIVPISGGVAQLPDDGIMMAVIHRHGKASPTPALGVLQDWSAWRGALATTVAHDSHNLVVFGRDPNDMAAAANALIKVGGGMSVAAGGDVKAVLPLPVCGLLSEEPTPKVAADFAALKKAAEPIADWEAPYRTFKAVVGASLACNPGPHMTDIGLTDGGTGEVFPDSVIEVKQAG
ncbi:adenine deaminase [Terrirubrum flagellatum]|uniref:adenine deaminase n=1 Tax=Terrirubrum flagellatum TaxID=2895980 RepID=UPI003CC82774